MSLSALLGLDHHMAHENRRSQYFFTSPLLHQRMSILKRMVGGTSHVIVVLGERGSGKTTLMNQFIGTADRPWHVGRIRLKPVDAAKSEIWRNLNNHIVFVSYEDKPPSVILDDAHELSAAELRLLLQTAFPVAGERKIQSVVLFAEPRMRDRFSEMISYLPEKAGIDKFNMAPLTEKQTADYLQHRIKTAGYLKRVPFSSEQIRKIHRTSGGLPGWINGEAYMLLRRVLGQRKLNRTTVGNLRWNWYLWWIKGFGSPELKKV